MMRALLAAEVPSPIEAGFSALENPVSRWGRWADGRRVVWCLRCGSRGRAARRVARGCKELQRRASSTGRSLPHRAQAATRVAANDKPGRERLCRYILRPPLANDRLNILDDGSVRLEFKRPWSDGTSSVELEPLALIARLAALVPPPRRHLVRYFGVLSSHASSRSRVVPAPVAPASPQGEGKKPCLSGSHTPQSR